MIEVRVSSEFDTDLRRLSRRHLDLVEELSELVSDNLQATGSIPAEYNPHPLEKSGGSYNGCMEFHLREDVLVLYSPPNPTRSVTLRRICTHAELSTGRFNRNWPD